MPLDKDFFKITPPSVYAQVRSSIRSGDILFCSGTKGFSKAIQAATGSIWSHVAFVLELKSIDRLMVLESVESIGVRTVPLSSYVRDYNATGKPYPGRLAIGRHRHFHANVAKLTTMSQFAVDLFGYPYDNDEIAKIAARITFGALGAKFPKSIQPDREFICSEYVARCYDEIGIKIPWNSKGFISPADFGNDPDIDGLYAL